jgi:hypothetical protein
MIGGVHLSAGREERAKAARLEALPREAEAQWGEWERSVKKKVVRSWAGSPLGRLGQK